MGEALRQRQLLQMKEQLPRLDAMIARAKVERPQDVKRFKTWKRQLTKRLREEGIEVPEETKVKDCVAAGKAHRWVIRGKTGTCRDCEATRTFEKKPFEVTAEHRKKVIEYIKTQPEGKRGPWGHFARYVGVTGTQLGHVVRAMLQDGTISEPAGKGSMVYTVVPRSRKARGAAIKLYEEQRQAEADSPKAPVSLEARRDVKARKAA